MIRLAKRSEIEEIMLITRACAVKMISEEIFQWNEHYPNAPAFYKDLERNELYVLTSEKKQENKTEYIVGCVTISSEKDEVYKSVDWLTQESSHIYIHRLAVHPQFQHRGYAKALMDFAEDFGRQNQITSIRLDTFSANKRNQRFYEARGYQRLNEIYFPKQSILPFYCYELVLL